MEKSYTIKCHDHIVVVGGLDNQVVADRTARLNNAGHARLAGSLDIIPEWEEGV